MENDMFVGLDIGTTKVACIIAERGDNGEVKVVGVGNKASHGLRRGIVVDIDKTVSSIKDAVEEAELMAGIDVDGVWVGIAGDHIRAKNSTGFVAIADDHEIRQEDVDRVIEVAKTVPIPQDYVPLHVIPQGFCIDDQKGIKQPIGMSGVRLETQVHIITGQATSVQNITKCVEKAGLKLNKLVLEPLASSYAVLDSDEKELGVVLIDIGGGTSDIAIYCDENIRHTAIVGLGGESVTRDISVGLKTPLEKAEEIKRKHGCAYMPLVGDDESITVRMTGGRPDRLIKRSALVGVIEARVQEILEFALMEVKKTQYVDLLGAGVVLTGGGAQMEGMREKAESIFQMPVRIGAPIRFGGLTDMASSPKYATGVGLCMFAAEKSSARTGKSKKKNTSGESGYRRTVDNVKSWFSKYF